MGQKMETESLLQPDFDRALDSDPSTRAEVRACFHCGVLSQASEAACCSTTNVQGQCVTRILLWDVRVDSPYALSLKDSIKAWGITLNVSFVFDPVHEFQRVCWEVAEVGV